MAITTSVDVVTNQMWPQGDIRDPLGVWGARVGVTGDASGGGIKVAIAVPALLSGAYVYTCYSVTMAQLTGTFSNNDIKARLLSNWPDVDPLAGVQGYATLRFGATLGGGAGNTAPIAGPSAALLKPADRFILLFDPRQGPSFTIVELEWADNFNTGTYSFEAYGYFWDRSVLNAPGGLRHPGAS